LPEISDGDGVLMLQATSGFCFATKAHLRCLVLDKSLAENLDRDCPINKQMPGAVHRTHAADSQTGFDPILIIERVPN
jgi:hypothetical protein